jgi:hypothetical protein
VRSIDGRAIGAGAPGPITRRIAAAFGDYARRCGTPF